MTSGERFGHFTASRFAGSVGDDVCGRLWRVGGCRMMADMATTTTLWENVGWVWGGLQSVCRLHHLKFCLDFAAVVLCGDQGWQEPKRVGGCRMVADSAARHRDIAQELKRVGGCRILADSAAAANIVGGCRIGVGWTGGTAKGV